MDVRKKLIEILKKPIFPHELVDPIEAVADYLLDSGVTVQDGKPLEAFLHPVDAYKGLKAKYLVFKADTGERVGNCFVLRPDKDPAAVEAIRAYARATDNETLAEDIYNWVGKGEPVQEWISVKEHLPQENEPEGTVCELVQVLLVNGDVSTGWCNRRTKLWWHFSYGASDFIDHDYEHTPVIAWQPLAQPPKGE